MQGCRSWEDKLKCVNILSIKDQNSAKIYCNRFVYMEPLAEGHFLPRTSLCAGLKCVILLEGQPNKSPKGLLSLTW